MFTTILVHQVLEWWFRGIPEASLTSQIMDYTSIESHLFICAPADGCTQDLQAHMGYPLLNFKDLIINFLKGTGIPCPNLFSQA